MSGDSFAGGTDRADLNVAKLRECECDDCPDPETCAEWGACEPDAACVWDESKHGFAPDGSVVVRFSRCSNPKPYYLQRVINDWEANRHYGCHRIHGEEFATLEEAKARAADLSAAVVRDDVHALRELARVAGDLLEAAEGWPTPNRYSESARKALRFIRQRDTERTARART